MEIYNVTFHYSGSTYCSNIAKADSLEAVKAHYSKYDEVFIAPANESDLLEAERKNKPIIICDPIKEEPASENTTEEKMEGVNMNYLESVKSDVMEAIKYDYSDISYEDIIYNRDEVYERLYDNLWIDDSVTGNGSGSYFFNSYKAREAVLSDMDTVSEAIREFCVEASEIGDRFLNEDWEYLDVTARCYVLGQALDEAIDELIEEYESQE